jgi:hypothetical protein
LYEAQVNICLFTHHYTGNSAVTQEICNDNKDFAYSDGLTALP